MQTSVIDLLVPTEIQVEDINETTSKITLEPLERGFWSYTRQCLKKNIAIFYAWRSHHRCKD